jgi:uncharacterized phiE125 gp8 family phage protein
MAEPVTLAEAKAQTNMVNDDSQDTFLTSLIAPARAYVERASRFFWVAATREESFGAWGDFLEIYRRPIASVDSITYGPAGDDTDYTGFVAPVGRFPLRIYPTVDDSFPDLDAGSTITVTYTSGALTATDEEYLIGKRAMLLLIGHWFEFREAAQAGIVSPEIAFAITSLLDELRPVSAY